MYEQEASVNHLQDVITWDAQAFYLQTPAAHTTENSNWDVREEKVKLNFGEKAQ